MKILLLTLISSVFLAIGCDPAAITGSGKVTTTDHAVAAFDKITVKGSIDVDVMYGSTPSVTIETDDNLQSRVKVVVVNDMLDLSVDGADVDFTKLKAHIVMPSISALTAHGSGNVNVGDGFSTATFDVRTYGSGNIVFQGLDATKMNVKIQGSGNVNIAGVVDENNCVIQGSGNFTAPNCPTRLSAVAIFGSGNADVSVSTLLFADIYGSGDIAYKGDPEVREKVSGSGKIIRKV